MATINVSDFASVPNDETLNQVQKLWGLDTTLRFLRYNENYIYQGRLGDREVIVRITHRTHRDRGELEAELDFVDFLSQHGVQVGQPYSSAQDHLVEQLDDDSRFCASVFQKAEGASPSNPAEFTPDLLREWGAVLGKMHRLAKVYKPRSKTLRKPWQQDAGFLLVLQNIDAKDELLYLRFLKYVEWINSLEKSVDTYGLVHGDLHHGNFFVHQGKITAFDFDDASYHFFIHDFAAAICGLISFHERIGVPFDAGVHAQWLLQGYETEHVLPNLWLERIPQFVEWRWLVMVYWIAARLKTEVFSADQKNRFLEFQKQCRRRVENPGRII